MPDDGEERIFFGGREIILYLYRGNFPLNHNLGRWAHHFSCQKRDYMANETQHPEEGTPKSLIAANSRSKHLSQRASIWLAGVETGRHPKNRQMAFRQQPGHWVELQWSCKRATKCREEEAGQAQNGAQNSKETRGTLDEKFQLPNEKRRGNRKSIEDRRREVEASTSPHIIQRMRALKQIDRPVNNSKLGIRSSENQTGGWEDQTTCSRS